MQLCCEIDSRSQHKAVGNNCWKQWKKGEKILAAPSLRRKAKISASNGGKKTGKSKIGAEPYSMLSRERVKKFIFRWLKNSTSFNSLVFLYQANQPRCSGFSYCSFCWWAICNHPSVKGLNLQNRFGPTASREQQQGLWSSLCNTRHHFKLWIVALVDSKSANSAT